MAAQGGFSYKPNVNRAVTKKWREASQANYGGDDWGDDDDDDDDYGYNEAPAPVSAGNARHPGWGGQGQIHPSNRSVTNPSPSRGPGRESFDRGDERRYFSSAGGGFESPYPTTQRAPFPEPRHDDYDQPQNFRPQPPPQIHTQGYGPPPPQSFRPSSRGQQYPSHPNAPFSAPGGYPHQRSDSGNRSNPGDMYQRRQSPVRPDSRASNNSARHFPPRKSSLSQAQPPPDMPPPASDTAEPPQTETPPTGEAKALPFIRPSDIYKRMEEEREKERRSQESSRPSLDLNTSRTRDSSTSARSAISESRDTAPATMEDTDSARRLKPTLDPVPERKSEYGFDNMLREADANYPPVQQQDGNVNRHPTNASSIYTDRPDPVSASTNSRDNSPESMEANEEPYPASSYQYNLPTVGTVSSFDSDFGSSLTPAATNNVNQPSHPPPPVPDKDMTSRSASNNTAETENLAHKPSFGYRSVVEQAFDQSQSHHPLSPASTHETLPRSNSASTSDISPIISRHQEFQRGPSGPPVTEQPIPEEPTSGHSRVLSDSTIKPRDSHDDDRPLPAPPVIQSGYRRDRTPPSRDNSPAKQPLSVQTAPQTRPGYGILGSAENIHQQAKDEGARGRSGPSPPVTSSGPSVTGGLMSPESQHSTTSDEYKDWQDQRKQFNARFGIQDSNPTTPGVPSPISRSESPTKGSVRDMAQKYETNSGRNTPTTGATSDYMNARPAPQSRLESFRPQIPGGWQSSTGTPQLETPYQEPAKPLHPPRLADQSRFESTESIPTARAPRNWQEDHQGTGRTAFAAAAAAGTALAGAFSGSAFSRQREDSPQRSDGEDSWERSAASSIHAPDTSDTRDFGATDNAKDQESAPPTQVSLPPTPVPKDTPVPTPPPTKAGPETLKHQSTGSEDEPSTEDYFPAPLRTSKSTDANEIMRPPIPTVHHADDSPVHRDNEQLQQDIVKSLTPKSSNFDSQEHQQTSAHADGYGNSQATDRGPPLSSSGPRSPQNSAAEGAPRRPFLEQRFSWEMESERSPAGSMAKQAEDRPAPATPPKVVSPAAASPATQRSIERTSETPAPGPQEISTSKSPSTTRPLSGGSEIIAPPTVLKDIGPSPSFTPGLSAHPELPFRKILAMDNQQQRIQAFNTSRESYAHSDGLLDQWILSMQTPDHADVFDSNGQVWRAAAGGQNAPRPSPSRPLPSISGTKFMQEDGKKLMDASKRFGGKAGVAAKGLFAKGKDKLRSVSASEKVAQ